MRNSDIPSKKYKYFLYITTTPRRLSAQLIPLLLSVMLGAGQIPAQILTDENILVVRTELILLNVSVTGSDGKAIAGLKKFDFTILDDKKTQTIDYFGSDATPASVSVVFDTSGSMKKEKIAQARAALARFVETTQPRDEYFLINFSDRPGLLLEKGSGESAEKLKRLTNVVPDGSTALYDAADLGIKKSINGKYAKKIMLVVSDGEDNNSRISRRNLLKNVQESGVIIYAVGIGRSAPSPRGRMSGRDVLADLAETSGGKAFFPKDIVETDEAFERIASEIRNIYSLGFYSADSADRNRHRLKVEIKLPPSIKRAVIRSREIYFSGENADRSYWRALKPLSPAGN